MALNIPPVAKVKIAGKTAGVLAPIYWERYKKVAIPVLAGSALAIGLAYYWKRSRG